MLNRSIIRGTGSYLPKKMLHNNDLAKMMATSHEWIVERTGIETRHIAAEGEFTSDLAANAARAALADAGCTADDIDLLLVATETPDDIMPSTAVTVQRKLGIPPCMATDLHAACSGFIYALTVADSLLKTGQCKRALVIGAETFSRVVDWEDRSTCILFGDGAGAVVLESVSADAADGRGVLASTLSADGTYRDILCAENGISTSRTPGTLHMAGREVFRHAVQKMTAALQTVLQQADVSLEQIDWCVPHQANKRILDAIEQRTGLPASKMVMTLDRHANTSAASIPLALDVARKDGRIKKENFVVLPALGAGLTWGACLIKW